MEYRSKDGKETKIFDALEWLAAMCSHVPNRGEQMARYYGFYNNVARGKRKKTDADDKIPSFLEPVESLKVERPELTGKTFRRNWARLIQKIYEVDPLVCPKYSGPIRIISFIEDGQLVKKILEHLDLWDVKRKPPPRANGPPSGTVIIFDECSSPGANGYIIDADRSTLRLSTGYPIETFL